METRTSAADAVSTQCSNDKLFVGRNGLYDWVTWIIAANKNPTTYGSSTAINFNNIKVDRSVVGSVNTAQVKQIDVTMDNIRAGGNEELANHLKDFTQAVLEANEINAELRDELIEGLSFISSQFALQQNMRKPTVVKSILKRIQEIVETAKTLGPLWPPLLNELKEYFRLG